MSTILTADNRFAVCLTNINYPAALEVRKLYRVLSDTSAVQYNLLRVIDESGEDYLYPASYFLVLELSPAAQEAIAHAETAV